MILWGGFQILWEMIQVDFGWWGFLLGDFRSGGLHGAEKKDGRDEVDFFGVCLVSGKQFLFGNRKFWLGIFRSKTNSLGIFSLFWITGVCMERYDGGTWGNGPIHKRRWLR